MYAWWTTTVVLLIIEHVYMLSMCLLTKKPHLVLFYATGNYIASSFLWTRKALSSKIKSRALDIEMCIFWYRIWRRRWCHQHCPCPLSIARTFMYALRWKFCGSLWLCERNASEQQKCIAISFMRVFLHLKSTISIVCWHLYALVVVVDVTKPVFMFDMQIAHFRWNNSNSNNKENQFKAAVSLYRSGYSYCDASTCTNFVQPWKHKIRTYAHIFNGISINDCKVIRSPSQLLCPPRSHVFSLSSQSGSSNGCYWLYANTTPSIFILNWINGQSL